MRKITPRIVKRKVWEPMVSDSEPKGKVKTEKVYPIFSMPLEHLPEAKDWDTGETYVLTLKIRMKSLSLKKADELSDFDKDYGNKADFEVVGIEAKGGLKEEKAERAPRYKEDEE